MRTSLPWVSSTLMVTLYAATGMAHHGTSITYLVDQTITLNGTVTEFLLNYPHPQVYFDVTDETGAVRHWGAEVGPTPRMLRERYADVYAWTRTSLKPGDEITITCNPHRKPGATACLAKEIVINGRLLPLTEEQAQQLR